MLFMIKILLIGSIICIQSLKVGTFLIGDKELHDTPKIESITDEIEEKVSGILLSKRAKMFDKKSYMKEKNHGMVKREISDFHSKRQEYEIAVNETITDYYAKRKAVMDRFYVGQRKGAMQFLGKKNLLEQNNLEQVNKILVDITPVPTTLATLTTSDIIVRNVRGQKNFISNTEKPNDSSALSENDKPGYHRVGERTHGGDERLLYQHNLGIGLKGKSEVDAAFEVILDESVSITCVELIPYNKNSTATMQLLKGGVKNHFVKIKLQPERNSGLSYIIKVWGVDK